MPVPMEDDPAFVNAKVRYQFNKWWDSVPNKDISEPEDLARLAFFHAYLKGIYHTLNTFKIDLGPKPKKEINNES